MVPARLGALDKRARGVVDGRAKFDLWPDASELGPGALPTGFTHSDGSPAEVFSSFKKGDGAAALCLDAATTE
jgi:hypothetical protein